MAKVVVYKPHDVEDLSVKGLKVFLAGTIDMGNSIDWQTEFTEFFKGLYDIYDNTYIFYNPRRDEGFGDDPDEYTYQANWELDRLESCDKIVMNILGTSKSPISLMELGTFKDKNISVICEPNFYRYRYVEIFCERYMIPLYHSMEEFMKEQIVIPD